MLCHKTGRGGRCTCFHRFPCSTESFRTKDHPGGLGNSNSPLVAITTVVPTSYSSVCRPPHIVRYRQDLLSQQGYVSDGKSSDHKLAAPAKLQRFRLSQIVSDMIKLTSMELQRPGITPVLSQWDLG